MQTERIGCDLCGGADLEELLVGEDFLHGTSSEWRLVRCRGCGLVFLNPRPAAEAFGLIYPADYSPHQRSSAKRITRRWKWQQWALRCHGGYPPVITSAAAKLLSWPLWWWTKYKARNYDLFAYQGTGKLLDYGCGSGKYLMRMQQRGWDVTGMDMSAEAVAVCGQSGVKAVQGAAPDETFGPESFDVVTLWHVLEHVPSPTRTVQQVHRVLRPGGLLVFGVPNIDCLPARWFGKYWFALDLPRHFTQFSRATARRLMEQNGYRVERIFAQRYGQTVQSSYRYLARETGRPIHKFLARSKRLCYALQCLTLLKGEPAEIVVQARKVESKK